MERGLTPNLAAWIEAIVGPVQGSSDESWDHGNSDVTRLELGAGQAAFLKRYRSQGKFEQERLAYTEWCPHLSCCAPFLGATESPARAILVGGMPGKPLLGRTGYGAEALSVTEQQRAYRKAGRFLAVLHGLGAGDHDPMPIPEAWRLRARTWARRSGTALTQDQVAGVLALVESPWPGDAPVPKRVPCHRDFTERNWLVDGDEFTVIDFEHARMDWALVDVERVLSSIPQGTEGLAESFLGGYGWSGTTDDQALLRRVTAVAALSQVVWAVEHSDGEFERAGRERLASCLGDAAL